MSLTLPQLCMYSVIHATGECCLDEKTSDYKKLSKEVDSSKVIYEQFVKVHNIILMSDRFRRILTFFKAEKPISSNYIITNTSQIKVSEILIK